MKILPILKKTNVFPFQKQIYKYVLELFRFALYTLCFGPLCHFDLNIGKYKLLGDVYESNVVYMMP